MHGCILEPTLSRARADVLSLEPVLWPWKVERLRDELRIDWGQQPARRGRQLNPEETSVEIFGDHLWVSRLLQEGFVSLLCWPHENIHNGLGKEQSYPGSWRLRAFRGGKQPCTPSRCPWASVLISCPLPGPALVNSCRMLTEGLDAAEGTVHDNAFPAGVISESGWMKQRKWTQMAQIHFFTNLYLLY